MDVWGDPTLSKASRRPRWLVDKTGWLDWIRSLVCTGPNRSADFTPQQTPSLRSSDFRVLMPYFIRSAAQPYSQSHSFSPLIPSSEGGGSESWLDSSAAWLRCFSSPTANVFLTPVFNACTASPTSAGFPDVDPSLLHYTHCHLTLSASSSSASNSPHSMAQKHLHRLLHLRSPLSSLLSPSPLSPIENLPSVPVMSSTMYKTPVKMEGILVMDGVLVSDSDLGQPRSPVSEFGSTESSFSSSFG